MNNNLRKLFDIARKKERTGIGLMSGTSLDGLDIALCRFTGSGLNTTFELLNFITIPYEEAFKKEIQTVFAQRHADLEKVCLLNALIGSFHGDLVLQTLNKWQVRPGDVDFIASHGQTIYHAPRRLHGQENWPNATLQIGDGDHLAVKTGIITISDFRQKHIAAGGEGAPLALYGDVILGNKPGEQRVLLNIGGIANLTWLPGDNTSSIICTDIGPGNTLIDAACRKFFGKPFDEDSRIALSGSVNERLLATLLAHPYFNEAAPKTTGPELFNLDYVAAAQQSAGIAGVSDQDLVCTLSMLTAKSIANFISENFGNQGFTIFISGGGARNPFIIGQLQAALPSIPIHTTNDLGVNPDAKEAILFALLGNEALCGEPLIIGNNPAVTMGKFSFPA